MQISYLTRTEVAKILGCHVLTVKRLVDKGALKEIKPSYSKYSRVLYSSIEVDNLLKSK